MTQQQIFAFLCLLLSITLEAFAKPPVSPAGGGWLQLDENHDFVGTVKAWFPDKQFNGLTAEAWLYIEELPAPGAFWSIIGQEDRFNLILHGNAGTLGAWGRVEDNDPIVIGGQPMPRDRWVHVVALYHAGAGMGLNGKGGNWCCPGGHLLESDKPVTIGGIIRQDKKLTHFSGDNMKFQGYIDEVRISDVVRYVGPQYEVPKGRFEVDAHTISLWHFDEAPGVRRYVDASGNGYDLWRGGVLAVQTHSKLTTTWGAMKRP